MSFRLSQVSFPPHLKKGVLEAVIRPRRIVDPQHAPGLGQQRGLLLAAAAAAAAAATPHLDRLVVLPVDLDVLLPEGVVPLRDLVRRHLLHLQDDDPGHDDADDVDDGQEETAVEFSARLNENSSSVKVFFEEQWECVLTHFSLGSKSVIHPSLTMPKAVASTAMLSE